MKITCSLKSLGPGDFTRFALKNIWELSKKLSDFAWCGMWEGPMVIQTSSSSVIMRKVMSWNTKSLSPTVQTLCEKQAFFTTQYKFGTDSLICLKL